ncbi:helix-turn-helix domain-containing protein [Echinicola shivajiensis]|uniref:helix-turn-helix domain-containing protein n=1 Tax=Echinicola shivajiensis TaxID=1035916 RepID=UPI001BFC3037|nr:helix-turn-helix domain-containing protein [Echinicola shivajiensis]
MDIEIITKQDLMEFKEQFFQELDQFLKKQSGTPTKRWLKSYEVRDLLGISPGTLQNLRINGTLPFTKVGGLMFYDFEDVRRLMESGK